MHRAHDGAVEAAEFQRRIGARVRERRQHAGRTQHDIAQHLGLTRSSVSNFEAGAQPLSLHAFVRLADYLDVPPGDLIDAVRHDEQRAPADDLGVPLKYRTIVDSVAGTANGTRRAARGYMAR